MTPPEDTIEVSIMPLPIVGVTACCVPVVPGTSDCRADLSLRTELCAVDANWIFGAVPTCDEHAAIVCEAAGWDWEELWREAGRSAESVAVPRADRQRHSQHQARAHLALFAGPSPGEDR